MTSVWIKIAFETCLGPTCNPWISMDLMYVVAFILFLMGASFLAGKRFS